MLHTLTSPLDMIGRSKWELDTPALVVDLDAMERNIRLMADFLGDGPVKLRPHMKTHKTPQIALMQIRAGAVGVTCQKVGEAEAMWTEASRMYSSPTKSSARSRFVA